MPTTLRSLIASAALVWLGAAGAQSAAPFRVEETSIADIHQAIRSGATTCAEVVQAYVERARAYNGVCTTLVTPTGAAAPRVRGTVRAGAPLRFPTQTIAITDLFPDFASYKGPTPDFGRMEPTASDPTVQQQFGMVVGTPGSRQVNALETLNLRGERSVTCKGAFDAHPSTGPLPSGAPAECEEFRKQPDALEYAAELDEMYGRNPDLTAMPLYCAVVSFKAVYDAKDMRSTGGGDVNYATDFAPSDSTLVARLREAGAIIYAKAHNAEYNGGSGNPGGDAKVERPMLGATGARETWGGPTCNPYDTTRETGGSSGGSGASVGANLVACSICESTGGSCRNPGTHNGVVTFVPTKGMISYGGGIGADPVPRPARHSMPHGCRHGQSARCVSRPEHGLLRRSGHLYRATSLVRVGCAVRQRTQRACGGAAARRHAHRRRARAHGQERSRRTTRSSIRSSASSRFCNRSAPSSSSRRARG